MVNQSLWVLGDKSIERNEIRLDCCFINNSDNATYEQIESYRLQILDTPSDDDPGGKPLLRLHLLTSFSVTVHSCMYRKQ